MRLVALLLIVPVPFIIAQFGRSAWTQFTIGSLYNWAMVLRLVVLAADELRTWRAAAAKSPAPSGAEDAVVELSRT